jgi:hypothetical protein
LFFKFKGCGNDAAATFKIYFGRAAAQWIVLYPRISFLPCYFTQKNPGTVLVFWKKKKKSPVFNSLVFLNPFMQKS